jgi:hypothetical protein
VEERSEVADVDMSGLKAAHVDAPAKVAAPEEGAEEAVVGKERWEGIQRLRAAGMTVSQIARATDLDRKTVRRCLRATRVAAVPARAGGRDAADGAPMRRTTQRRPLRARCACCAVQRDTVSSVT